MVTAACPAMWPGLVLWPATGKLSTVYTFLLGRRWAGTSRSLQHSCPSCLEGLFTFDFVLFSFSLPCAPDDNMSSEIPLELQRSTALSPLSSRGWNLPPSRANIGSGTCKDLFLVLFSGIDYLKKSPSFSADE